MDHEIIQIMHEREWAHKYGVCTKLDRFVRKIWRGFLDYFFDNTNKYSWFNQCPKRLIAEYANTIVVGIELGLVNLNDKKNVEKIFTLLIKCFTICYPM